MKMLNKYQRLCGYYCVMSIVLSLLSKLFDYPIRDIVDCAGLTSLITGIILYWKGSKYLSEENLKSVSPF